MDTKLKSGSLLVKIQFLGNQPSRLMKHIQVSILCDNQVAIARAKNNTYNEKNKHIRLRHNIVKRMLNNDIISLNF